MKMTVIIEDAPTAYGPPSPVFVSLKKTRHVSQCGSWPICSSCIHELFRSDSYSDCFITRTSQPNTEILILIGSEIENHEKYWLSLWCNDINNCS